MLVRVLLLVAAFAVLYGCDQEGAPVEAQEAGVERPAASSEPQPLPDQISQDATLQAYLDQMSILMLDRGLSGWVDGGAKGNREVRTLAALQGLDPARKRLVVLFLMEASLIQNAPGDEPVMDLVGADLSGAILGVVMHGTRLVGADLRGADLKGAIIQDANLSGANLSGVTGKTAEQLDGQAGALQGAIMPDGRKYEEWLKDEGSGAEDERHSDPK